MLLVLKQTFSVALWSMLIKIHSLSFIMHNTLVALLANSYYLLKNERFFDQPEAPISGDITSCRRKKIQNALIHIRNDVYIYRVSRKH